MATISENLEAIKTAKASIKSAIEGKGQDLTDVPFTEYAEKIADIQTEPNLATKEITANGTYNASDDGVDGYSSVDVNLPIPDLSATTATADDVLEGKEFFNASGEKVAGTYKDMLQARIDVNNSCEYLFYEYEGDNIDFAKNLDLSKVTKASRMFDGSKIQNLPKEWNLSGVKEAVAMFSHSTTKAPEEWDFSGLENANGLYNYWDGTGELRVYARNATNFQSLIYYSKKVTKIDLVDTPKATNFTGSFREASLLETVEGMNCVSVTNSNNLLTTFSACYKLTNLTIKNIRVSLQIGSGTSYGHLLTLDSLLNTIKELWTNTSTSTRTLTMGTANTAKLADVYVKLIDITDEMRAEDEYIDNKAPFVQCESTDEGAMLITEYVTTVKNWQLA